MNILEFLKSFIFPTKMFRFRSMSALISLLIFVVSTYVLSLPYGKALADSVLAQKETYNFLALTDMDAYLDETGKEELRKIADLGCAVNNEGMLACEGDAEAEEPFEISYVKDGITKKIHIFFDFYDINNEEDKPKYELPGSFSIENETYKYVENEEHYFVVFTRDFLYYQAHQVEMGEKEKGMEITHNEEKLLHFRLGLDYKNFFPDFSLKLENPESFGDYFTDKYLTALSGYYRSTAFFQTFLVTLIFPLVMVLLFWLFFRRTGNLKRFKEYFNVAAISSIVPLLLSFGIAWVFPLILNYHIFIFSLFYLFALFRINNMRTES